MGKIMELYAINKTYITHYLEAMENATTDDRIQAASRFGNEPIETIVTRSENGNEATIKIVGPLSLAGPSPLARFFGFGGTGYVEIIAAAKELGEDDTIDTVKLHMLTPGGEVIGMDEARQELALLASKKTVIAQNHGEISSAGYYLATAVTRIEAMSPLAITGSIGVVKAGLDIDDALARDGIKKIKVVSSNAPNKQADPKTAQGLKVVQNEVDAIERVFIHTIAEARNTTDQDIIDNFGQGGVLIASDPNPEQPDAIKVGMIDSVVLQNADNITAINGNDDIPETHTADGGQNERVTNMDLSKLKAEHPAIYAQALAEGVEVGITQERKRVSAHITMGEASGDMVLATKCITDGVEHDAATNAQYMAAQMNKKSVTDRNDESEDDLNTDGAGSDATNASNEDELAKALAADLGVEIDD